MYIVCTINQLVENFRAYTNICFCTYYNNILELLYINVNWVLLRILTQMFFFIFTYFFFVCITKVNQKSKIHFSILNYQKLSVSHPLEV